jgi:DnaJ family protein A protein 2
MNYYKILGLNRNTATQEDIKKSYRKLVLEHHPDKGGDPDKFRQIQEAYEVLSNSNKKHEYDNNHQTRKMADIYHKINIPLKDIYTGTQKSIKINTKHICDQCKKECNQCNGLGIRTIQMSMGPFTHFQRIMCNGCGASGIIIEKSVNCGCINGYFTKEKKITFDIERGDINIKTYRIDGLGEQPKRDWDIPGDLIIEIHKEESDSQFKRVNYNLHHTCKIKFTDAITGIKIKIQHYTKEITIDTGKIFGIINPNKEYIIGGEGIYYNDNHGDLIIKFEFIYPSQTQRVSEKSQEILSKIFDKIEW